LWNLHATVNPSKARAECGVCIKLALGEVFSG
jgi:hypothetical protein